MRWSIYIVAAYLAIALQTGLAALLHIRAVTPNLLLVVVVFVGRSAPLRTTAWAAVLAGLLADLSRVVAGSPVTIVGPWCLGFMLAGYAAFQLRGLVFRESAWAVAGTTLFVGLLAYLVAVAALSLRGFSFIPGDAIPGWEGSAQLVSAFLELLYTSAWAVPLGKLLLWSDHLWGFPSPLVYRPRRAV